MESPFQVEQIDHVELNVPDRYEAAKWYQKVFGLEVIEEFQYWADDPNGPLMVGTKNAATKLALFSGEPVGSKPNVGFHLVAFRVCGMEFVKFLRRVRSLNLFDRNRNQVVENSFVDHGKAISIYFCDPWKNEFEITTYDVDTFHSTWNAN